VRDKIKKMQTRHADALRKVGMYSLVGCTPKPSKIPSKWISDFHSLVQPSFGEYRFYFHGHYTFCGRRTPIDLDAVLANLALQEGDERLPQTLKLWIRSEFLHGTILHLSSKAHLKGEERMTLWEVIAFLEVQPIEKSWKELIVSQAGEEGIRRIAAEAGELMLNSPGASCRSNIRHGVFAPMRRGARSVINDQGNRLVGLHLQRRSSNRTVARPPSLNAVAQPIANRSKSATIVKGRGPRRDASTAPLGRPDLN